MSTMHAVAFALGLMPSVALAAWPEDHLDVVDEMVAEISPLNNEYGSPSLISYQDGVLSVFAECGGFVAQLLQATYDVLDDDLMSALFDDDPADTKPWASPDSTHYFQAFMEERAVVHDGERYGLVRRRTVAEIAAGDLLVSEYSDAGKTGHTMLVRVVRDSPRVVGSTIPGRDTLLRYSVQVIDVSATVHMNKPGTTDTRYMTQPTALGGLVNDRGLGRGDIFLYADVDSGALVGWTWSITQTVAYQGVDPTPGLEVGKYRPILAGRIVGPGL